MQEQELAQSVWSLHQQKMQEGTRLCDELEMLKKRAIKAETELEQMTKGLISGPPSLASPRAAVQEAELRKQATRERERAEKAEADSSRAQELRRALADKMAAANERWEKEGEHLRKKIEELQNSQTQRSINLLETRLSIAESELHQCKAHIQDMCSENILTQEQRHTQTH